MQKLINVDFHYLPLTMSTLNTFHLLSGGLRDTSGNAMTTEITSLNIENKRYHKKSRGPSGARLLGSSPLGLLDFVLHALRALRPCDPRNGAMIG